MARSICERLETAEGAWRAAEDAAARSQAEAREARDAARMAQEAAEALRRADEARKARTLVTRLRAALRGD